MAEVAERLGDSDTPPKAKVNECIRYVPDIESY